MNPYILEGVAREQIADWQATATNYRLAKDATASRGRAPRPRWLSWTTAGRRHDSVELVWPDGVSSIIEVPRQPQRDDMAASGLANRR